MHLCLPDLHVLHVVYLLLLGGCPASQPLSASQAQSGRGRQGRAADRAAMATATFPYEVCHGNAGVGSAAAMLGTPARDQPASSAAPHYASPKLAGWHARWCTLLDELRQLAASCRSAPWDTRRRGWAYLSPIVVILERQRNRCTALHNAAASVQEAEETVPEGSAGSQRRELEYGSNTRAAGIGGCRPARFTTANTDGCTPAGERGMKFLRSRLTELERSTLVCWPSVPSECSL